VALNKVIQYSFSLQILQRGIFGKQFMDFSGETTNGLSYAATAGSILSA